MEDDEIVVRIRADGLNQRNFNRTAVGCILLYQCLERLVYYTVYLNLIVLSKGQLGMTSTDAATVSLVFAGLGYILTIVGGVVADTVAGEYNTIYGSGFLYIIGLFLHAVASADYRGTFGNSYVLHKHTRMIYLYSSLACISVGNGGINANIGNLLARQQVPDKKIFSWLYWCKNVGALIVFVVVFLQCQYIVLGIMIAFGVMVIAQFVLVLGRNYYTTVEPEGSLLIMAIKVCLYTRCVRRTNYNNEALSRTRRLVKVFPIFGFIFMYWTVYAQMQTTFLLQAERLDLGYSDGIDTYNSVTVSLFFNPIIILLLIPVMEIVVYPLLSKRNIAPSLLRKIGIGMIFAAISVLVAGIVEKYRKMYLSIDQSLFNRQYNASTLSVFVQVPQFALIGMSEVFTSIGGLEFAHSEAPADMKGVMMGLFISTEGFGTLLAAAIIIIIKVAVNCNKKDSWFPNNLNEGKWEYYFFFLSFLSIVNLLCFIGISYLYKYEENIMIENEDSGEEGELTSDQPIPSVVTNDNEEQFNRS